MAAPANPLTRKTSPGSTIGAPDLRSSTPRSRLIQTRPRWLNGPLLVLLAVLVAGPLSFSSPSRGQGNPLETLREISDSSKGKPGIEGADAARTDEERHGAGDDVEPSETSKRADIKKPSEVAKTVWEYPLFRSGTAEDGQPTYVHLNDLLIAILTFTLIFVGLRWLIRLGLGKIFT